MTYTEFLETALAYMQGGLSDTERKSFDHYLDQNDGARIELQILQSIPEAMRSLDQKESAACWRRLQNRLDEPFDPSLENDEELLDLDDDIFDAPHAEPGEE